MSENKISHFGKGIPLNAGFDIGAQRLADHRCIAKDIAERDALDSVYRANGLLVWVQDEQTLYVWDEPNNEWRALAGKKDGAALYWEGTRTEYDKAKGSLDNGVVVFIKDETTTYVKTSVGLIEVDANHGEYEVFEDAFMAVYFGGDENSPGLAPILDDEWDEEED